MKTQTARKSTHTCINVFAILIIFFLAVNSYFIFEDYQKLSRASSLDSISSRMNSLFAELNELPSETLNKIRYLASITSTKELLFYEEKNTEDLEEFVKQSNKYHEIIILSNEGEEIVKIKNFEGSIIKELNTKNKYSEIQWEEIKQLEEEQVTVSEITAEGSKKTPILTYATPINKNKEKIGYLIIKENIDSILRDIRYAQRNGEQVFLINNRGEYLANPSRIKEFNEDNTIFSDHPDITKNYLEEQKNLMEINGNVISSRKVNLAGEYFSKDSEENNDSIILLSITNSTELRIPKFKDFLKKEIPSLIIIVLTIMLLIIKQVIETKENKS